MRIAKAPPPIAIMARSSIVRSSVAGIAPEPRVDLAFGEEHGGLAEQEQCAENVQHHIQHG
jgi:hypothetical protein